MQTMSVNYQINVVEENVQYFPLKYEYFPLDSIKWHKMDI